MELDPHLPRAFYLQEARGPIAIIGDLGVGSIVAYNDLMLQGESDRFFEELGIGCRTGGVVRIVEEKDLAPLGEAGWNLREVRQKSVLPPQRHHMGNAPREQGGNPIDRIPGAWNEHNVTRIHER